MREPTTRHASQLMAVTTSHRRVCLPLSNQFSVQINGHIKPEPRMHGTQQSTNASGIHQGADRSISRQGKHDGSPPDASFSFSSSPSKKSMPPRPAAPPAAAASLCAASTMARSSGGSDRSSISRPLRSRGPTTGCKLHFRSVSSEKPLPASSAGDTNVQRRQNAGAISCFTVP